MPLFNVYNYHSQIKPHIPYRFNCDIWPYDPTNNLRDNYPENKILSYAIKKISQPVFKINLENTRKLFGNTQYTIPVFNFAETELEITFEETDDMAVYKFLCSQSNGAFGTYMRSAVSSLINIEIEQFDYTMKRTVDRKHYIVELKSFSQPQFNNNGYGAPLEITARFYVMYVYDNPLDQEVDDSVIKLKYKDQGIDRDMLETPDFTEQYKKVKSTETKIKEELGKQPKQKSGSSTTLPKGKNLDAIHAGQAALLLEIQTLLGTEKTPDFNKDFEQYAADGKLSVTELSALQKKYNINDIWLEQMQGSMAAERLFKGTTNGQVTMTAEEYTNAKKYLNDLVKTQINAEINAGNKDWKRHTKTIIDANGEEKTVEYFTYSGSVNNVGFNRNKNNEFKNEKVEDIALHTTGNLYADLNAVMADMARGGQSISLFEDFAIVREETLEKGRAYSAFSSGTEEKNYEDKDYADRNLRKNTLGIEVVGASGVNEKKGLHTTHNTGSKGYIQLVDDEDNKINNQSDALIDVGIDVGNEKIVKTGTKRGIGLNDEQVEVISAVTMDMNERNVGNFNFETAEVDTNRYTKDNIARNKQNVTQIISHDSVSNKRKEGEGAPDAMQRDLEQLKIIYRRNKKK